MNIQLAQILFQIINFSVVAGALTYLLYHPVQKVLDERASRISDAQKAADEALTEKERLAQLEKKVAQEAEKKAAKVLEQAHEMAQQTKHDALTEARQKAEAEIEKLKNAWEEEKKQYKADIKNEFVSAVTATAAKVISADLDAKKHEKIITKELDALLQLI